MPFSQPRRRCHELGFPAPISSSIPLPRPKAKPAPGVRFALRRELSHLRRRLCTVGSSPTPTGARGRVVDLSIPQKRAGDKTLHSLVRTAARVDSQIAAVPRLAGRDHAPQLPPVCRAKPRCRLTRGPVQWADSAASPPHWPRSNLSRGRPEAFWTPSGRLGRLGRFLEHERPVSEVVMRSFLWAPWQIEGPLS